MHLKPFVAAAALAFSTLFVGAFDIASAENGHGFNCTPGNPGRAEAVHTMHGKDDQGNGDDCAASVTPPGSTSSSGGTSGVAGAQVSAETPTRGAAATSPAAVTASPRFTG